MKTGKHPDRVHLKRVRPADAHETGKTDAALKFGASLDELEASAHVPIDDQVATQPETPAQAPISEDEVARQSMLRVTGPL